MNFFLLRSCIREFVEWRKLRAMSSHRRKENPHYIQFVPHRGYSVLLTEGPALVLYIDYNVRFKWKRHPFGWGILFDVKHGGMHGNQWKLKGYRNSVSGSNISMI
jgi:hypothetical protein